MSKKCCRSARLEERKAREVAVRQEAIASLITQGYDRDRAELAVRKVTNIIRGNDHRRLQRPSAVKLLEKVRELGL